MSEKDIDMNGEQLDEFQSSYGDPSSVPEPVNKKAKAPGKSKKAEDDPVDAPTAVKPEKAKEINASKMGMIQAMVQRMNAMKKTDLQMSFDRMIDTLDQESISEESDEDVVEVVRTGHTVTSGDVDMSEDVTALFAGDDSLTEEFKEKAATIFEAAVVSKINEQLAKYVVDVETEIQEEKARLKEETAGNLDQYLDYVIENWMDENKLAVEAGIKSEVTESFVSGLKDLFTEHYIDIPDDKVDVVEQLAARSDDLESRLNEEITRNATMKTEMTTFVKAELVEHVCESLTETQKEKFRVLAESVDFVDEDSYVHKLDTLKESYFSELTESRVYTSDFDDAEPLDEEVIPTRSSNPEMSAYVSAISRTLKK
tara:strand:+ start:413 stop:1522 length:1110 start_codon:yes stop_codon:yes gene_type:complete